MNMRENRLISLALSAAIAGSVVGCSASENQPSLNTPNQGPKTDQPLPIIQGAKELTQEEENTQVAKHFLEVAFATDTEKIRSSKTLADYLDVTRELSPLFHPDVRAEWTSSWRDLADYLDKYNFCRGVGLKKVGYKEITSGYREAPSTFHIDKLVTFEFVTPCAGKVDGKPAIRKTIEVTLRATPDGKYAPINFQGPIEYPEPDRPSTNKEVFTKPKDLARLALERLLAQNRSGLLELYSAADFYMNGDQKKFFDEEVGWFSQCGNVKVKPDPEIDLNYPGGGDRYTYTIQPDSSGQTCKVLVPPTNQIRNLESIAIFLRKNKDGNYYVDGVNPYFK